MHEYTARECRKCGWGTFLPGNETQTGRPVACCAWGIRIIRRLYARHPEGYRVVGPRPPGRREGEAAE